MYKIEKIFDKEDIDILNRVYDILTPVRVKRYYNLFYLIKKDIIQDELIEAPLLNGWNRVKDKINKFNLDIMASYFLEYSAGSFCRAHTDNVKEVGLTSVTLIHKSHDLKGGEAIGFYPHWKSNLTEFDLNRYTKHDDCNNGEPITPVVMHQELGETLVYSHDFKHAVSLVESGTRRVFVCWFKK